MSMTLDDTSLATMIWISARYKAEPCTARDIPILQAWSLRYRRFRWTEAAATSVRWLKCCRWVTPTMIAMTTAKEKRRSDASTSVRFLSLTWLALVGMVSLRSVRIK